MLVMDELLISLEATWIEEHVSYRRRLLVDLERMAAQDDAFRHHPSCIGVEEAAHGHQRWRFKSG